MPSEILVILFAEWAVWSILAAFAPCSPPAPRLHLADCWLWGTKAVLEFLHHCAYCLTSNSQPAMLRKQIRGKPYQLITRGVNTLPSHHTPARFPLLLWRTRGMVPYATKTKLCEGQRPTGILKTSMIIMSHLLSLTAFGFWEVSKLTNQVSSQ